MLSVSQGSMQVRAYGTGVEDLDIDFEKTSQPHAVTAVLHACLLYDQQKIDHEVIWGWSLNRRIQALLSVVIATQGKALDIQVPCAQPECGELFELPLDLNLFQQPETDTPIEYHVDNAALQLRLPNGFDQLKWMGLVNAQAFVTMASDLIVSVEGKRPEAGWSVDSDWLESLGERLEEYDRLTALQLQTRCPLCDVAMKVDFDLEHYLLELLLHKQIRVLRDIHHLASVYHWTETEIMALTPQRRRSYLALIDAGGWA